MNTLRIINALALRVRGNLLWFLIAAYGLAAWFPAPGDGLRAIRLGELPFTSGEFNPTHLLLGVLLFCVGMSIHPEESRQMWRMSRTVLGGLAAAWLLPLMGLAATALLVLALPAGTVWPTFVTGALLVAAMPPANSSSVWSELSGGQSAATVAIIILGTLLTPVLTPWILGLAPLLGGVSALSRPETAMCLEVLIAFVVLPTALGMAVRSLGDALLGGRVTELLAVSRLTSLGALLVLNYANAAAAAPQLTSGGPPSDALTVSLLSLVLCGVVFGLAAAASSWIVGAEAGRRAAFVYVTGMKNTGAALTLAASLLAHQPLVILVPVFYTIAQHLAAAVTDRVATTVRAPLPVESSTPVRQASTTSY